MPQPIDMTPPLVMVEPGADHNNLTNQLATILSVSFGIEPKGRGRVYTHHTPITTTSSLTLTLEAIEFLNFQSLVGRMVKPH
jgi:hypothetical protein